MKSKVEKILVIVIFLGALSLFGFWTYFIFRPSEPITSFMITHILSEYITGVLGVVMFVLFIRKSELYRLVLYFEIGMLFYASIQAVGWAISSNGYPALFLFFVNIVLIVIYMVLSVTDLIAKKNVLVSSR